MENHIEILKEDISVWEYKFPSFPGAPRPLSVTVEVMVNRLNLDYRGHRGY